MKKSLFRNKKTNEKGFLLAEIVIALLILSVSLLAIISLFTQASKSNALARDYTQGTNLARKQLELLKTHSPEYWASITSSSFLPWQDEEEEPLGRYSITTKALPMANESLVQVTVTATWQERGLEYRVQLLTFYPAV